MKRNKWRLKHWQYEMIIIAMTFIIISLMSALCVSCGSKKVIENTQDSVRVEYKEKIVEVPVKVYVEVPAESKEITTNDTTSTLKTKFAKSTASLIWKGVEPFLFHSLENIPQRIEKTDTAKVTATEKVVWKTRRVTYTKIQEVEKPLKWWQSALQYIGFASLLVLIILTVKRFKLF